MIFDAAVFSCQRIGRNRYLISKLFQEIVPFQVEEHISSLRPCPMNILQMLSNSEVMWICFSRKCVCQEESQVIIPMCRKKHAA